jgi:hypothetical protein
MWQIFSFVHRVIRSLAAAVVPDIWKDRGLKNHDGYT